VTEGVERLQFSSSSSSTLNQPMMVARMTFGPIRERVFYCKGVRATLSNIPKRALCGLYKNSGSGEMRLMG